jgi:hypothetical protein
LTDGQAQAPKPYFQQRVEYTMRVKLDDQQHRLDGSLELVYTNNSPDTLREIFWHLWPNAYVDNRTDFARQQVENRQVGFHFSKPQNRGYIDSLRFQVEGVDVPVKAWNGKADVVRTALPAPLPPGAKVKVTTPFHVKVPKSYSRLGHVGQQYQFTQWFPKPAVYDRNGWHPMSYLDQGEFYSEFGSFNVYIQLPIQYIVGATGTLQNPEVEASYLRVRQQVIDSLRLADSTQPVMARLADHPIQQTEGFKELHFYADQVHDFAWFCDKTYLIEEETIALPRSGRKVLCRTLYNEQNGKVWQQHGLQAVMDAVLYYSQMVGDYPHPHCTAVDGALSAGAGMEYPMITVLGGRNVEALQRVTVHEVGHNWFMGQLGSNERMHPWLDEGINTYYEERVMRIIRAREDSIAAAKAGVDSTRMKSRRVYGYRLPLLGTLSEVEFQAFAQNYPHTANRVQPIEYPSEHYIGINYGVIVYMRTPLTLMYLEQFLGTELFDRCMQEYYRRWEFKHPSPADIQAVYGEVSGRDLSWFFSDYYAFSGLLDLKLRDVQDLGDGRLRIVAENPEAFALPIQYYVFGANGVALDSGFTEPGTGRLEVTTRALEGEWVSVVINPWNWLPEWRIHNNRIANRRAFRSCAAPRLRFGYAFDTPSRRGLGILPTLGYNTASGLMLGAGLHYGFFPKRTLEFHLAPMYGFGNQTLNGSGGFTLRKFGKTWLRKAELHHSTAFFADFLHSINALSVHVQRPWLRDPLTNIFTLRSHHLGWRGIDGQIRTERDYLPYYTALDYHFSFEGAINRLGVDFEVGYHTPEAIRVSFAHFTDHQYGLQRFISYRLFGGAFLSNTDVPTDLSWGLAGSGDPLGRHVLLDRAGRSSWLSNQIVEDHASLRIANNIRSADWMLALNLDWKPLAKLPLGLYADGALVGNPAVVAPSISPLQSQLPRGEVYRLTGLGNETTEGYFAGGLSLKLFANTLNIYLPIVSNLYADNLPQNLQDFANRIVFSLRLFEQWQRMPF